MSASDHRPDDGDHCDTIAKEKPILRHEYMVLPAMPKREW